MKLKRKYNKKMRKKRQRLLGIGLVLIVGLLFFMNRVASSSAENKEAADSGSTVENQDTGSENAGETVETAAGTQLLEAVTEIAAEYPELTVGFTLVDQQTGETVTLNADSYFTSASLYKLFVAYGTLSKVDAGEYSLTDIMDTGSGATVDDYLTEMITVSANEPGAALAKRYSWKELNTFVQDSGFTQTSFNPYYDESTGEYVNGTLQTSPQDVTDILQRLYDGELLSAESTDYFIGLLEAQELVYALNTGLDSDAFFAHKTGILDFVSHDAGMITYQGNDYLVTVMSEGWTDAYNEPAQFFLDMGQAIMTYLYAQDTGETGS